ncbi:MAG: DUF2752 domain-containing protein [Planctomycetes bacterium]|nr:DUF2752 domain-containing protein [Planctomycetota bacterium]
MMSSAGETIRRAKRIKPGAVQHPLGRLIYRVRSRKPAVARSIAALLLAACVALLAAAVWILPDARGVGSHEQFGMPPCVSIVLFGVPCPTCGMTTAFAHAVRGELWSAFNAQPAGFLLALATVAAVGLSLGTLLTGKVWHVNWYRVPPTRVTIAVMLIVLGGWIFKIATGTTLARLPIGEL